MTTRIAPLTPPYTADIQKNFDVIMPPGIPPLGIFRTVAHNPRVLSRMIQGGLLDKGSISIAERELVILRTCALCKAEYEWGVHVTGFSQKAGFTQEQIGDTLSETPTSSYWSDKEMLLLQLVDQLYKTKTIDDGLWSELSVYYADDQLIELIMLAGLYHAVSFIVNACGVQREGFAAAFPDTSVG